MTCKDCIHYDACADLWYEGTEDFCNRFAQRVFNSEQDASCGLFENKEDYVKLPCKIGCDAWEIITDDNSPLMHKTRVTGIYIGDDLWINTRSEDGLSMSYNIENVGMDLFFDEESAENFVKIRISKNV